MQRILEGGSYIAGKQVSHTLSSRRIDLEATNKLLMNNLFSIEQARCYIPRQNGEEHKRHCDIPTSWAIQVSHLYDFSHHLKNIACVWQLAKQ
jgi:hypothetical protein